MASSAHSLRNSQLIIFDNAAAGHDGVMSDRSGDLIVKPCKPAEIAFYESARAHPNLLEHIPTFLGTLALPAQQDSALAAAALSAQITSDHPAIVNPEKRAHNESNLTWAPSGGGKISTDSAIVMENVAAGFQKPNILDVKLGARLWADDAPPEKRARLDKVAAETTSLSLGFRIAGMKTWQGPGAMEKDELKDDNYKNYDKEYGRSFTASTVHQGFHDFLFVEHAGITKALARRVIGRFCEDLEEIRECLEKEESRMYSASLLFVYEGDGDALRASFDEEEELLGQQVDAHTNGVEPDHEDGAEDGDEEDEELHVPKIQAVKLIDFAHAAWTPGQGPDENLLHGLRSVVAILDNLAR